MKFTKRFNEALKNSGKSQAELATYTGVSRQLITEFKKGRAYPSLEIFYKICEFLDESADYLLGLEEENGTKYNRSFNNFHNSGNINIR